METKHQGRENVRTIGYCIYCGARGDGVKLTKEHIIPHSLGADAYLKDASCPDCAKITKDFEHHVARNIFGQHRIHSNIQTRHPDQRPGELPARLVRNGTESRLELPIKDHPYFLAMPVWEPPGILRGASPSNDFPGLAAHLFYHIPDHIKDVLDLSDGEAVEIRPDVNGDAEKFGRALAKIAYCHAVSLPNLDGFRSLAIQDLILGKYSCVPYFVGSHTANPPPPDRSGPLHRIDLEDIWFGGIRLLVSHIRLFARDGIEQNGMPIYTVIVGAPRKIVAR